jgi:sn1-specific diacylglycerol lipase
MRGFCDLCCGFNNAYQASTGNTTCCCSNFKQSTLDSTSQPSSGGTHLRLHGDTKGRHHLRAFKFLSSVEECDLIYANFQNELFLSPFCVVVDHYKKAIVVTIRGTLSMR